MKLLQETKLHSSLLQAGFVSGQCPLWAALFSRKPPALPSSEASQGQLGSHAWMHHLSISRVRQPWSPCLFAVSAQGGRRVPARCVLLIFPMRPVVHSPRGPGPCPCGGQTWTFLLVFLRSLLLEDVRGPRGGLWRQVAGTIGFAPP